MNDQTEKMTLAPNAVHLVRTSMLSTLALSQMADQKANMVMGASFVVFTLAIGQARSGTMLLPIAILASGAFVAAICAIVSVLPKVTLAGQAGTLGQSSGDNILFFGVFTHMSEQEFADRVIEALGTDEDTYRMMLRDVYQNGQVLHRKKYRFLGYAYRAFLAGLVGSFVAFFAEMLMQMRV
tara:strand:+ start:22225 stop:22770 length:546 start_codon:yes stop_codon:yes gene_type:complete